MPDSVPIQLSEPAQEAARAAAQDMQQAADGPSASKDHAASGQEDSVAEELPSCSGEDGSGSREEAGHGSGSGRSVHRMHGPVSHSRWPASWQRLHLQLCAGEPGYRQCLHVQGCPAVKGGAAGTCDVKQQADYACVACRLRG